MAESFDAWWLPDVDVTETRVLRAGELECRYPTPTPGLMAAILDGLADAGRRLAERPVADVVEAVDAAAARLADPRDAIRGRAERLVALATGYSPPMVRLVLDRMAADWRAAPLRRLLAMELGDPAALDAFGSAPHASRAYGPRLSLHVFAGNVPGVAVTSLVRSLLVKGPAVGKLAADQPVLPVLFAEALADADAEIARSLAVTYWPGGSNDIEAVALGRVDAVVVYGGDAAVESIRERVSADQRLVVHGPRFSVGLVGAAELEDPELPRQVATAVATFDQKGCVSPHTVWVEDPDGSRAEPFARALGDALDSVEEALPRGTIRAEEAAAIQQERGAAELRAHGGGVRVLSGQGTLWTVILDPDPAFRTSCLNRLVRVQPVPSLDQVPRLLAPAGRYLQSVALAVEPHRRPALAHALARAGATRITSFSRLPWPPPHWHHDGRGPLRELLRWVDIER